MNTYTIYLQISHVERSSSKYCIVSVVSQSYAVNLMEEYVLRGNSAILKCHIPSFVSEYVSVISWIVSEGEEQLELDSNEAHGTNYL